METFLMLGLFLTLMHRQLEAKAARLERRAWKIRHVLSNSRALAARTPSYSRLYELNAQHGLGELLALSNPAGVLEGMEISDGV